MLKDSIEIFSFHNTKKMRVYATIKVKKPNNNGSDKHMIEVGSKNLIRDCLMSVVKSQSLNHAAPTSAQKGKNEVCCIYLFK